eukprot:TRINITY_DN662_c0_g1_i1.p1 TRINITY_DN662_c0_g1~~TRINITY_DN662_c0_g1_i1.p1  ORF type:complete len:361 (+),score=70.06 TRINITY_DN662_c0_g1_i1:231-1313(+)
MRTVEFINYNNKLVSQKNIDLLYYTILKEGWFPSSMFEFNALYYHDTTPVGIVNLTELYGAPVLASRPHFLECEDSVALTVSGLKGWSGWESGNMTHTPDYQAHDIRLSVEPYSGINMDGKLRLQLVVKVEKGVESAPNLDWLPYIDIPQPPPLSIAGLFEEFVPCRLNLIPESLNVSSDDGAVTMADPNSAVVFRGSVDYTGALDVYGSGPTLPLLCFGRYHPSNNTFDLSCEEYPAGRSCTAVYQLVGPVPATAPAQAATDTGAAPAPGRLAYQEAYKNLRTAYYPLLWIEEGAEITDEQADDFKNSVLAGLWLQEFALIFGCTVGSVMLVGGLAWLWSLRNHVRATLAAYEQIPESR